VPALLLARAWWEAQGRWFGQDLSAWCLPQTVPEPLEQPLAAALSALRGTALLVAALLAALRE
jgi:hypothetical protein